MNSSKSRSGRRRWTSKQRQRLLARFHQSQLTQRDFATRHGVGLSTLSKWLRVESEAASPPSEVPGSDAAQHAAALAGGSRQPARLDCAAAKRFEMCRRCPNCCRRCHAERVTSATRVLVATTPVDLRGSFNRLYSLVVEQLKGDPLSGHLFVFTNRPAQSDQGSLLGRRWFMGLCQTIGERPVHLAGE